MSSIHVYSAGKGAAYDHYQRSVKTGLPLNEVLSLLEDDELKALIKKDSKDNKVYLWGDKGGQHGRQYWELIEPGDLALCYSSRKIIAASFVIGRCINREVAVFAWPDLVDEPYEYIFFLTKPSFLDFPVSDLPEYFGKQYQGLRRLGKSDEAIRDFGSAENFLEQALLGGEKVIPRRTTWIIQANPDRYDVDSYLSQHAFIYWSAKQHAKKISVGDKVYLWRSGADAGIIASGEITEPVKALEKINRPECLGREFWADPDSEVESKLVGITLDDVRLDVDSGMVTRDSVIKDQRVANAKIIRVKQMTVFSVSPVEVAGFSELWNAPQRSSPYSPVAGYAEGDKKVREHCRRERNPTLVRKKKEQFQFELGYLCCEVCGFRYDENYPPELADGFIEAHHIKPLAELETATITTLDDLILVCANCHRMVHRSKEVEQNFALLKEHFSNSD